MMSLQGRLQFSRLVFTSSIILLQWTFDATCTYPQWVSTPVVVCSICRCSMEWHILRPWRHTQILTLQACQLQFRPKRYTLFWKAIQMPDSPGLLPFICLSRDDCAGVNAGSGFLVCFVVFSITSLYLIPKTWSQGMVTRS